jgi:hypothetical protein
MKKNFDECFSSGAAVVATRPGFDFCVPNLTGFAG